MPSRAAVGTQPKGRAQRPIFCKVSGSASFQEERAALCSAPRVMRSRDSWSRGLRLGLKLHGHEDVRSTCFTKSPGRREAFVQLCHFMEIISGPAKLQTHAETGFLLNLEPHRTVTDSEGSGHRLLGHRGYCPGLHSEAATFRRSLDCQPTVRIPASLRLAIANYNNLTASTRSLESCKRTPNGTQQPGKGSVS